MIKISRLKAESPEFQQIKENQEKKLKILVGYVYFPSPYHNVELEEMKYLQRMREAGFDVDGFCLTLNPPGPTLIFEELDALWKRRDRILLNMYDRLIEKLEGVDVFINESGVNLHPEFVRQLPVFTVFQCFDDPESSMYLSKPTAYAYDMSLVANIAEVDTYRKWGAKNVYWRPYGVYRQYFDPTLTYEQILYGTRDMDLFMMSDRLSRWRKPRLDKLAQAFPDAHFYGKGWQRGYLPQDKELEYLRRTKIGPNLHNSTGPLNARTFYLPANGVLQICDNKHYLGKIFKLDKEVVGFDNVEECIDLCRYYLVHDEDRRKIAADGWKRAVTDYGEIAVFERVVKLIQKHISEKTQFQKSLSPALSSSSLPILQTEKMIGYALIVFDPRMGPETIQERGLSLREPLQKHNWYIEYVDIRQISENQVVKLAADFDVVYLLNVPFVSLVKKIKEHTRAKVVFALADALWKEYHRAAGWQDLDAILSAVDALTSDNRYVADYGRKFNKPITIVPMATQIEKFDAQRDIIQPRKDGKIRIGWVGSQGTVGAISSVKNVLEKLAERYPDLELRVLGAPLEVLPHFTKLSVSAVKTYTEDDMIREVLSMDIGIHPIALDLEDYVIRGGMKAFVYMSAGIPSVSQNAGECADLIQDGVTGMLASSEQDWFDKLDRLIGSPELRGKIGKAGIEVVRKEHSLDYVARQLEQSFTGALQVVEKPVIQPVMPALSHRLSFRPRILLIADIPNWVFDRHCKTLQHYLSDDFDFTISYGGQAYNEADFDLIYPLEWNQVFPNQIHDPAKYVTGIRSHLWWPAKDFNEFTSYLASHFQRVHVVSQRLYKIFSPKLPNVTYVTHGVDTQFFIPTTPTDQSGNKIRLGWAGNRTSAENKGFVDILDPLSKLPGVEFVYCGYSDKLLTREEMRHFYDALDVYICASENEGSNNPLLEAASMERAIITTDNGTVPEYLKNGESALIVERRLPEFIRAVEMLRDHPQERIRLGKNARQAVLNGWDWKVKAEEYRTFFWSALSVSGESSPAQSVQHLPHPVDSTNHLQRAEKLFVQGDLKGAQDVLKSALDQTSDDIQIILAYGNLLLRSGDTEGARREFVKATVIAPTNVSAFLNLAAVLVMLKRYEDAEKITQRALTIDPDNIEVLKLRGYFLNENNQPLESALAYMRVLELKADDLETWLILGKRYVEIGDWISARLIYMRVIGIDPSQQIAYEALKKIGEATQTSQRSGKHPDSPQIAFAILTYNALEYTKKCLKSIAAYTPVPYTIYILDNASTDETPTWLAQQKDAHLHYELSISNLGVSGGRNRLIQMILPNVPDTTALVFMDNDIELFPGWIDPYLELFRTHPDAGIAGVAGYWAELHKDTRDLRGPANIQPQAVDIASGGFACWIRASLIRELGFFDEILGKFWHEDDDYSIRAWAAGYSVYALPRAAVVHHAHKSGTTNIEVAHRGSAQNQKYLVHKWRTLGFTSSQGQILKGVALQPQPVADKPTISPIKSKLKIVVDGFIFQWQAGQPLGISRVWSNLLPELAEILPDSEIIVLRRKGFPTGLNGFTEVEVPAWQMGPASVLEKDDQMLARTCSELGADVFLSTYYTRSPGVRNIQMMYDMIPEVFGWDLSNPEWLSKQRAITNASEYITISNSTKQDLARLYGIPADKVSVAHCGVMSAFKPASKTEVNAFRQKYGINRPYFLLVGKREGYKNSIPCYIAFKMLNTPRLQLVAIGGAPQLNVEERKVISQDQITVLPTIPDEEMVAAYTGALALVYPSVYEGFGLPIAEAMACGCPVITGRNSSLVEVGGDAVIYVNPLVPEEILSALRNVMNADVQKKLEVDGYQQVKQFTWKKMAQSVASVIRQEQISEQKQTSTPVLTQNGNDKPLHFPHRRTNYRVTAIVSTYKSEEFIRECLTDLVNQTIGDNLEIIVVDAASPENEQSIVAEFQKKHKNIIYIRTGERIGVYAAWNLAIQNATGKYITPLSANDRLRRDAHEIMSDILDEKSDIAMVYGDSYITNLPHQTFDSHVRTGAMVWPDYSFEDLLEFNRVGPHPMWRRSLHSEIGYFDEQFTAIGDQEFWLRIAEKHSLLHIPVFTGLYWKTDDSLSGNLKTAEIEAPQARRVYLDRYKGQQITDRIEAGEKMKQVSQLIEKKKFPQALSILQEAAGNVPEYFPVQFGCGQLLAYLGKHEEALAYLQRGIKYEPGMFNMRLLLVDELIALNKLEDAAVELKRVLDILPGLSQAQDRKNKLSSYLTQLDSPKQTSPSVMIRKQEETISQKGALEAAETLSLLLDADDLSAALQKHQDRLDDSLLDLVRQNAKTARSENETDLSEGLDNLAEYIEQIIAQRETAQINLPIESRQEAAMLLQKILGADDLLAALNQYEKQFSGVFLELIQENAETARKEGQDDLADGMDDLAIYVEEHLAVHQDFKDQALVDVVIPIYGQAELVRDCVESVLATTDNAHLILVDDCTPGIEIQRLFQCWQNHGRITLSRTPNNQGFIGATRLGAGLGNAPYILFLNSDTKALASGWLEGMIPNDAKVAVVGAKLLYPPTILGILAGKVQHAGVARNAEGVPYHPFMGWDADAPEVNTEHDVNAVTGGCYLVRRKVWDELGGWDPIFERGVYEDVDFCWQSRKHGYLVQYRPQACLYHYSSASEGVDGKHLLYDKRNENLAKLMSKWQPLKSDEILFYGKKIMDAWQQANIEIDRAVKMIKAGNQAAAGKALEKAVKMAPNVPASRIAYAQWLVAGGKHAQAAEQLAQALKAAPAMWDIRLLLVDEWMAAGKFQNTAEELAKLNLAFPEQPVVKEREAKLASLLNQPTSVTPLSDADRATQTLEILLDADDLNEALEQNNERLDAAFLSLVLRNAESARVDGNKDLAEGLDALAEYVQNNLPQAAKPKEKSSKRHKN